MGFNVNPLYSCCIDDIFQGLCDFINHSGTGPSPRGSQTKELLCVSTGLLDPRACIIRNKARKLSLKYIAAELLWYLRGDRSIENIKEYASMWTKVANEDGTANSNYGYFIFHQKTPDGNSQFDWVYDSLITDSDSRQAVINFNQVDHKKRGTKDFVCTIATQYFIRYGELRSVVCMRSNDLIFGFGNDIPFFSFIHQLLFWRLKQFYPDLRMGALDYFCSSLHVYEKHFTLVDEAIAARPGEDIDINLPPIFPYTLDSCKEANTVLRDITQGTAESETLKYLMEVRNS